MASIPNWSGVDTPGEFLAMPNTATSGYFWAGMDLMVVLVIFITLATSFGWEAGLLSAGFVGLLMTIFLVYLGLVSYWVLGTFVALLLFMFIYIIWSSKYD